MKVYIKAMTIGLLIGAMTMEIINIIMQDWLDRPFKMGGEFLFPALLGLVCCLGWQLAETYFKTFKYKEIYSKGFSEGIKVNKYKIIIPLEEHDESSRNKTA